ncbi:MAG: DUF1446 domain-containing protein [Oscillibacter sp.]|nr:DUF1446 domain-containing protein [Oscillibacter sp.]
MVTVYAPLGMLGYGFPESSMEAALRHGFDVIALDAGSVDPGPYYLGSGTCFTSRVMVKRDLTLIVQAGQRAGVPILIGTAGGSGASPHLDWAMEILNEVIQELKIHPKVARIDAELDKNAVLTAFREGRIENFETTSLLRERDITDCVHIVAQMGIQPYIEALEGGADIIMGGRAYDAAVIAAYPIWKGEDVGLSYHMGKIIECGTAVALPRESDGMLGVIDGNSFVVTPADPNKICKPDTVAAHTLYERSTPFTTEFPGGGLDMSASSFTGENNGRSVRVRGTRYVPPVRLTLKLEGARHAGYRCICLAGIRDPFVIEHFAEVEEKVRAKLKRDLPRYADGTDYRIIFRRYGAGEIMKERDPEIWTPKEIGLVIEVLTSDQDTANTVCALARSGILHMGFCGRRANSGNLAFLYTPAEFPVPACYEFALYHLMVVDNLVSPFPITWIQM